MATVGRVELPPTDGRETFESLVALATRHGRRKAACEVRNAQGKQGRVTFDGQLDYESFQLSQREPVVEVAAAAITAEGHRPLPAVTNGGLDANWMYRHGIPTVTLGCGQTHQHTVSEALDLDGYWDACRIAWRLARGD